MVALGKGVENPPQFFRAHPDAGVRDPDEDYFIVPNFGFHSDPPIWRREFDRVLEQVPEHLLQPHIGISAWFMAPNPMVRTMSVA